MESIHELQQKLLASCQGDEILDYVDLLSVPENAVHANALADKIRYHLSRKDGTIVENLKNPHPTCHLCRNNCVWQQQELGLILCLHCAYAGPFVPYEEKGLEGVDPRSCNRSFFLNKRYKRVIHFRDWILRIQGLMYPESVQNVQKALEKQIDRLGFDKFTLTPQSVRHLLRMCGIKGYHNYAVQLCEELRGKTGVHNTLSNQQRIRLMDLFLICERAFTRINGVHVKKRKNFFNYGFLLQKLLPYIDADGLFRVAEFKREFKTLGAQVRQEALWRLIKEDLDKELNS